MAMSVVKSPYPDVPLLENVDLIEMLLDRFDNHGSRIALKASRYQDELKFDELRPLVEKIASGLVKAGLKRGDVGIACMNMRIEVLPIALGLIAAGGIFTSCDPQLTPDEIRKQISDSNPVFLFVQSPFLEKMLKATDSDQIKNVFVIGEYACDSPRLVSPLSLLTQDGGDCYPSNRSVNPQEDVVFLFYSSGTTGRQKGVAYTHFGTISSFIMNSGGDTTLRRRDSPVVICTPVFHLSGFFLMLIIAYVGNTSVIMEKFDMEEYLMHIEQLKVDIMMVVPSLVMILANDPLVKKYDLSSVREVMVGGAPLGPEAEQLLREAVGDVDIRQCYGMTECVFVSMQPPNIRNKAGSVGVLRPNVSVKIVDVASGATLGPNQTGELCAKCPTVMKGYWNNPEADKNVFDDEGWVHSGDIAYYDSDGYFFIADRMKELIKYKGYQVPPAELESLLLGHPDIADACVIGVPDKMAGELPKAFVVLRTGAEITAEDVEKYVQDRTTYYKWLRAGVEFLSSIPKSPSGKILRRLLRDTQK